ncbi:hypothetical protein HOF65_01480 [bacterium]|nr:hypothetical protein [bacterium]MBT6778216.1 hypothetical protein [bacterium]
MILDSSSSTLGIIDQGREENHHTSIISTHSEIISSILCFAFSKILNFPPS